MENWPRNTAVSSSEPKENIVIHPDLYKRDSAGRVRFWRLESNGSEFRTIAGLHPDGNPVVSGWSHCQGKQGRTDVEQCAFEVAAKYKHQLAREYHASIDTIDTPNFFEPMLAKTYEGFPAAGGYTQPKLDGIRCIARATGLFSRQGQPIVAVPHVMEELAPLFAAAPDLILDGELYNHDLREDFGAISSLVRKQNPDPARVLKAREIIQYHIYDLPSEGHRNFSDRFNVLRTLLSKVSSPWIVVVPTTPAGSEAEANLAFEQAVGDGYEGGMFRLDLPYEQKRSKSLLKRKDFITREFPIVSIEAGNGNWRGVAKRMTLRNDDGTTFGAGIRGNKAEMAKLITAVINEKSVATVRYFMLSPDGVPRFPVVIDAHLNGRVD